MATSDSTVGLDGDGEWWSESALGLGVVLAATLVQIGGTRLVSTAVAALEPAGPLPTGPSTTIETAAGFIAALALVAVVYAVVGVGVTSLYLNRRGFDPGFVVERPDREDLRWLGGLLALAMALVWGGSVVMSLRYGWDPGLLLRVPPVFVGSVESLSAVSLGSDAVYGFLSLTILVFAGVMGPAVGMLFHGVLQNSLRRIVPGAVAIGGTAVLVPLTAGATVDPFGAGLVVVFALAVGYAYERTENLVVPMVAYAALNAFTLTTAALILLSQMGRI